MKNIKSALLDLYFVLPIIADLIFAVIIWLLGRYIDLLKFDVIDKSNQGNIMSNLISTDVSLAGFILAAVTIIVTFKANLKTKTPEEAKNAYELIFSSDHYSDIVAIFKKAIIELLICALFLYIIWISADNLSIRTLNRANVTGILLTTLTIVRSLYILFVALNLEKYKEEE